MKLNWIKKRKKEKKGKQTMEMWMTKTRKKTQEYRDKWRFEERRTKNTENDTKEWEGKDNDEI